MKKIIVSLIICLVFSLGVFAQKTAISTPDTAFLRKQLLQPDTVTISNRVNTINTSSTKTATDTKYKIQYEGDSAKYKSKNKQPAEHNFTPVKNSDE